MVDAITFPGHGAEAVMGEPPPTSDIDEFVESHAFIAELNDGTRVRIRPIAPKDKDRISEGWKHLSMNTRYMRFLHPKSALSNWELSYLTEIDYRDHFAWGAELVDEPGQLGIGIARYIRDGEDPLVAEAAVTVVDDYQQMGLGRILLRALTEAARQNGIERFRAEVSSGNEQVISSLTRLGATADNTADSAVSLELHLPRKAFGDSAMYEALRTVAENQDPS
jgi:RimJ/RimL family protein N-acetyltransferase